jgi:hypothetical protein
VSLRHVSVSIFTPSSGSKETRYIICSDYHAKQYTNHAHTLHVTVFIHSVSSSFTGVSKLSLIWCIFVLLLRWVLAVLWTGIWQIQLNSVPTVASCHVLSAGCLAVSLSASLCGKCKNRYWNMSGLNHWKYVIVLDHFKLFLIIQSQLYSWHTVHLLVIIWICKLPSSKFRRNIEKLNIFVTSQSL